MEYDNEEDKLERIAAICVQVAHEINEGANPVSVALGLHDAIAVLMPVLMEYEADGWISARDAREKLNATITEGT